MRLLYSPNQTVGTSTKSRIVRLKEAHLPHKHDNQSSEPQYPHKCRSGMVAHLESKHCEGRELPEQAG